MVTRMRRRTTTAPSNTTGRGSTAPTARMAVSGGLMMAVNCSMPNIPRFETENVAPVYSLGRELACARAVGQGAHLVGDLSQSLGLRVEDDGRDEPVLDRDGDADVDSVVVSDPVAQPMGVDFGMLRERGRDDLQEHIVERNRNASPCDAIALRISATRSTSRSAVR